MTTVIWLASGRVVVCDDEIARRWIADGLAARYVGDTGVETTSETSVPKRGRLRGVETR